MSRYTWKTLLLEFILILAGLLYLIPIYILVNVAVTTTGSGGDPITPTAHPTLANFARAWSEGHLQQAFLNSLLVTVFSVAGIVLVGAFASYPLARVTRRWSRLAYGFFLAGLLLPTLLALFPLYTMFRDLGLLGSIWSLVLLYTGTQLPFAIFMYTQFLRALPIDFEEAAVLDGCSPLRVFWTVTLPLLRPVTGTVVILTSILVWNDFFAPLLYLSGSEQQTMPVAIFTFVGQYVSEWNVVFAGLIIGLIPILLFYFLLQRSIIKGFSGGLKA